MLSEFPCYLEVNGNFPLIKWRIEKKEDFDRETLNIAKNSEFSIESGRDDEKRKSFVNISFASLGEERDYKVEIIEESSEVLINVTFSDNYRVKSSCKKDGEFKSFIETFLNNDKGNIVLEICCQETGEVNEYKTGFAFKNQFSSFVSTVG